MLGDRLKQLRSSENKTQQQIADYLGITRAAYSHFENNRNDPDKNTLVKLATLYNVTTDYLLGRDINKKTDLSNDQLTIAAHIDDDVSEDEMKEILSFIDYIKKRDHSK